MELKMMKQKHVNEKATIEKMKQVMRFLSEYAWMLNEQDALVEDGPDIMDFITYSRSVIDVGSKQMKQEPSILRAIEQRDEALLRQEQRLKRLELLLRSISFLPVKERKCILLKYVQHYPMHQIAMRLDVSVSTANRILHKAYLHLAQLLHMEVMTETYDFS